MSKSTSSYIINGDTSISVSSELVKGVQAFLYFINDGMDIDKIFDVDAALAKHEVTAAEIAYVKSNPEIAQLFEEQYLQPTPNLEELLKLPEDSLGFAYASNLISANFTPHFYPQVELKDDVSYLALRMRQTHDIWHTVTGYGFDIAGGLKLAAFQIGQNRDPVSVMSIAGLLMNTIKMNKDLSPIISLAYEGYNVGCKAKPFLAQKWEEAWEKPLADWRAELNVTSAIARTIEERALAAI
ncbi:Coq4 family protein [Anabaena sp. PCC 7108]|uniref:Coq4 family protein n=1 Tax=Anabaena sp. PCC 7108 TaxID=163908 RepID=UPI000344C010|nr:Coq4 family protein [Anabaena sp. PCC 7108]